MKEKFHPKKVRLWLENLAATLSKPQRKIASMSRKPSSMLYVRYANKDKTLRRPQDAASLQFPRILKIILIPSLGVTPTARRKVANALFYEQNIWAHMSWLELYSTTKPGIIISAACALLSTLLHLWRENSIIWHRLSLLLFLRSNHTHCCSDEAYPLSRHRHTIKPFLLPRKRLPRALSTNSSSVNDSNNASQKKRALHLG